MNAREDQYNLVSNVDPSEEDPDSNATVEPSTHHSHSHSKHARHSHATKMKFATAQFSVVGITQIMLLLLVLILTAVFYTREWSTNDTLRIATWDVSLDPCIPGDTLCMPTSQKMTPSTLFNCSKPTRDADDNAGIDMPTALCQITDFATAYDHASTEALSTIDVIFMCASSQVVATCLALVYMTQEPRKMYTKCAMGVITVYGLCAILLQNIWLIPMNNVLIVLIILVTTVVGLLVFLYNPEKESGEHAPVKALSEHAPVKVLKGGVVLRLVEVACSVPLLAVATLAVAGNNSTSTHLYTCFSICVAAIILIASRTEYKRPQHHNPSDDEYRHDLVIHGWKDVVFVVSSWLALLPAVMYCCVALYNMKALSDLGYTQRIWAIASLAFFLAYILTVQTLHSFKFAEEKTLIFIMDIITVGFRFAIILSIMVGALAALDA